MDLIDKLREIVGERVSAAPSERLCYSSDASQVKGMPDYAVRPLSTEEVSKVVALAAELEVPMTARGAGTGLAGGATVETALWDPGYQGRSQSLLVVHNPVWATPEEERSADPARILPAQRPRGEGVRGKPTRTRTCDPLTRSEGGERGAEDQSSARR